MDNHGSPWRISWPQKKNKYVGKFGGHEHASHPSISNQIGTSRIPILKSIILKGQNWILTYYRVGLSRNTEKNGKHIFFCFL